MSEIPTITQSGRVPADWRTRHELARAGLRPVDRNRPDCWIPWTNNPEDDKPCGLWSPENTEVVPSPPSPEQMRADRHAAIQWAREVLADPTAVVLDTETTSLHEGHVIELAAVDAAGNIVAAFLMQPAVPVTAAASKVHGITAEDLADCLPLGRLAAELDEHLTGRRIIAWNAPFDRDALARSFAAAGINRPPWLIGTWDDAMVRHAEHSGIWDSREGRYKARALEGPHRAAGDGREVWDHVRQMADLSDTELAHVQRATELDDEIEQILAQFLPDKVAVLTAQREILAAISRRTGLHPHTRPGQS